MGTTWCQAWVAKVKGTWVGLTWWILFSLHPLVVGYETHNICEKSSKSKSCPVTYPSGGHFEQFSCVVIILTYALHSWTNHMSHKRTKWEWVTSCDSNETSINISSIKWSEFIFFEMFKSSYEHRTNLPKRRYFELLNDHIGPPHPNYGGYCI